MRTFTSLHNHTTGSIGDGLMSPKELIEAAKAAGQGAVAVTDHGSLSALWDAKKAAEQADIKLISGCEIYFVEDSNNNENTTLRHLILLAKNATGYKNLLSINKLGFDKGTVAFKRAIPRVDWNLLEELKEGLICTSGCGNGIVSQYIMQDRMPEAISAARRLSDIFGDDFALELQPHNLQRRASPYSGAVNQQKINLALKKIGEDLGIRCIVATDAHYAKPEHHRAHDVYLCIGSGQPIVSGSRLMYDKHDFYVKTADQVYDHFARHLPIWGEVFIEALFENTSYFSDKCESPVWIDPAVVTGEKSQLPSFPYKDEPDYNVFLDWKKDKADIGTIQEDAQFYRYRSEKGLEQKIVLGKIPQEDREECQKQMLEEFDVLEFRNFSSYMLITAGFLEWCRNNDVVTGPGRGSIGGSITAYLNGIHQAYPKKYGLIFARFLNKYKEAYPDCDNDVAPSGRGRLQNYLKEKYGEDNIAGVSNINTITPKVYARDIARVFEFGGVGRSAAAEVGNNIADSIPSDMKTVKQALAEAPLFGEYAKQYPELAEFAELLCGKPRALSTHAAGIIISKRPLTGLVPLRRDVSGALVIEHTKELAEANGMIKFDLLGLETLDIITETYSLIKENKKPLTKDLFDYEVYDKGAYDLIGDGDTFGVFQFGSTAVHVCKKIKPRNIEDLALISALVRPAAKDIIPDLVKVRNGEAEMKLLHPSLARAFEKTYGFGLFEESLMFLALDVAGWDLHDADKLRKLTKEKGKNPEKVKQWRKEFIEDAVKNNIPEDTAIKTWEIISLFGDYGFNKSHSVLYSMLSYQTAFLKSNYPIEFLVSNLMSEVASNAKAAKDNINKIKAEIRNHNVKIVPPDINTSSCSWKIVDDKTLMTGLDSLKYMGKDAIPELIAKRPFSSFQDLIYRTDASKVRSPSIMAMAASGSLDSFGLDRKLMFHYASDYRAKLRSHMGKLDKVLIKEGWKYIPETDIWIVPPGESLEERRKIHLETFSYPFPEEAPWSVQERFALEEYYMGEGISGDVFDRYPGFFDREKTIPYEALRTMFPWTNVHQDERLNRKSNTHFLGNYKLRPLEGVVTGVFVFVVKKEDSPIFGQEMARISLADPWGEEGTLIAFPEAWAGMKKRIEKELSRGKQKIEPGIAISFLGMFQWDNEKTTSFILSDILDFKGPPALPEDRSSKKVKIQRSGKVTSVDLDLANEDLLDKLEDEMLDNGLSTVDYEEEEI